MKKPSIQRVALRYLASSKPPEFYAELYKKIRKTWVNWDKSKGIELKPNDKIRARKDIMVSFPVGSGQGNSGYITKGTILQIPRQGTSRGDVFCDVVSGNAYSWRYDMSVRYVRGDIIGVYDEKNVALSVGHTTRHPYDLGKINPDQWQLYSRMQKVNKVAMSDNDIVDIIKSRKNKFKFDITRIKGGTTHDGMFEITVPRVTIQFQTGIDLYTVRRKDLRKKEKEKETIKKKALRDAQSVLPEFKVEFYEDGYDGYSYLLVKNK